MPPTHFFSFRLSLAPFSTTRGLPRAASLSRTSPERYFIVLACVEKTPQGRPARLICLNSSLTGVKSGDSGFSHPIKNALAGRSMVGEKSPAEITVADQWANGALPKIAAIFFAISMITGPLSVTTNTFLLVFTFTVYSPYEKMSTDNFGACTSTEALTILGKNDNVSLVS